MKKLSPDTLIMAGGYSCLHHEVGMHAFPHADYIVIGEADLTVGPFVQRLLSGERPKDLPGVISHDDTPDRVFVPGEIPRDLNTLAMPDYSFVDIDLYRNFNHYRLVPIVSTGAAAGANACSAASVSTGDAVLPKISWMNWNGCTIRAVTIRW